MRVGFDLDGCLYDFGNAVRRYLDSIGREYGFKDNGPEPHSWNFFEYWGMDRDEFKKVCDDGVDAGYIFSGPARPNAAEAVNRVADGGHEIIIITDRFFGTQIGGRMNPSHAATIDWLADNGIPYHRIHFSANKLTVPTDMFVEDKLENYDALVDGGVNAYLIDRPWNQVPGGDARKRIKDIIDYADAIELATTRGYVDLTFA